MLLFPKFSLVRGLALGASRHFPQLKYAPAFVLNMCVHRHTPKRNLFAISKHRCLSEFFWTFLHKIVAVKILFLIVSGDLLNFLPSVRLVALKSFLFSLY